MRLKRRLAAIAEDSADMLSSDSVEDDKWDSSNRWFLLCWGFRITRFRFVFRGRMYASDGRRRWRQA